MPITQSLPVLEYPAYCLGFSTEQLKAALTSQEMTIGGERVVKTFNSFQCNAARDSLAKTVYSQVFNVVIERINSAVSGGGQLSVYVLDIFGFEIFRNNYLEQLCINYANEVLQQLFVNFTIKKEKQMYADEGVQWQDVSYKVILVCGQHTFLC